jgi:hypothetical protein
MGLGWKLKNIAIRMPAQSGISKRKKGISRQFSMDRVFW